MKEAKKFLLVQILKEFKLGSSPSKISKKLSISKQNLNYYVGKLKKLGCIEKKGYGVWEYIRPLKEVKSLTTRQYDRKPSKSFTSPKKKEIRGHAFIWKIEFVEPFDWFMIIRHYRKRKLTFNLMKHNKILRTIFNNRKIWLGKKGITIYEPIDFIGRSSFEVKGRAVFEMDLLIRNFLKELGLRFRPYRFTTSREHYGIIRNELARQYNDRKEKMHIRSEDGTVWMWIDDSKGLGELENKEPNINRQVQNFWNDHKNHKFEVDASFILNGFDKLTGNLNYHAENMKSHVDAIKILGKSVQELTERVKELKK